MRGSRAKFLKATTDGSFNFMAWIALAREAKKTKGEKQNGERKEVKKKKKKKKKKR